MKKYPLLTLLLVVFLTIPAGASVTKKEALKIAKQYAPKSYSLSESDKDGVHYEFEFKNKKKTCEFEIHIKIRDGRVILYKWEHEKAHPACCYKVSKAKAKTAVLAKFKNAKIKSVTRQTEDGSHILRVTFTTPEGRGSADVHGTNGKITQWTIRPR